MSFERRQLPYRDSAKGIFGGGAILAAVVGLWATGGMTSRALAEVPGGAAGGTFPCNADVNKDGVVDSLDIDIVLECFQLIDCSQCVNSCDVDCSGVVDFGDFVAVGCVAQGGSAECCPNCGGGAGVCCLGPDCLEITQVDCDLFDGTFIPGVLCIDNPCGGLFVSCCLDGGECIENVDMKQCASMGYEVDACPPDGVCIPPGIDCWATGCGDTMHSFQKNPIPADFFGPGSDPFAGIVHYQGGGTGGDTQIQRLLAAAPSVGGSDTIPIELIALTLSSCEPITVTSDGGQDPTDWDVDVDLSPTTSPTGQMTITKTHENGGTFRSEFYVQPKFTFTEVGNPSNVQVLDTADIGKDPAFLQTTGVSYWVHDDDGLAAQLCGPFNNFVPGVKQNTLTLNMCCTPTGHAGPGHLHVTGQICTPCPEGACCNTASGTCTLVPGQDECKGEYMGDGTDCRDTDGDGIADWFETNNCNDPNRNHCYTGTDPNNPDTDGDGLTDGYELKKTKCDPCVVDSVDTNNDGIGDACGVGKFVKFSQPPGDLPGEDIPSNIDWKDFDPNVVVGDDFVSDGRPITAVRWWGSNIPKSGGPIIKNPGIDVGVGLDLWATLAGPDTYQDFEGDPIPADFFEPGSNQFAEKVYFEGVPLVTSADTGLTDTIIERLADAVLPDCGASQATIPIEIVALSLRSLAPITVTYSGGSTQQWDIEVHLSDAPQQQGQMTIQQTCEGGGIYSSVLPVLSKLTFTCVSTGCAGQVRVFDAGLEGLSPNVFEADGKYVYDPDSYFGVNEAPAGTQVDTDGDGLYDMELTVGTTNFCTGIETKFCDCCKCGRTERNKSGPTLEQAMWAAHGVATPQSPAERGACCDHSDGSCTENVLESNCQAPSLEFFLGLPCTDITCDPTTTCTVDQDCDNGNSCTLNICSEGACVSFDEPAGTACGDPTDTYCDNPDTCDGAGACNDNVAPDGTPCDDGLFCTASDACQSGSCAGGGDPCEGFPCDEANDQCIVEELCCLELEACFVAPAPDCAAMGGYTVLDCIECPLGKPPTRGGRTPLGKAVGATTVAPPQPSVDTGIRGGFDELEEAVLHEFDPDASDLPQSGFAQASWDDMVAFDQAYGLGDQWVVPFAEGPPPTEGDEVDGADRELIPGGTDPGRIPAPPLLASFAGTIDDGTRIPPDTHGAVGPNHIVEILNSGFTIYDRGGGVVAPQITLQAFWSSLGVAAGQPASYPFDPKILYDQYADRWVVTSDGNPGARDGTNNSWVLVGISQTNSPTGLWNLYFIRANINDVGAGVNHTNDWADYPGIGLDPNNIVITNNVYAVAGGNWVHADVWVINKATMMAGPGPLVQGVDFALFHDPCGTGGSTFQPCHTFGQSAANGINHLIDQGWSLPGQRWLRVKDILGVGAAAVLNCRGGNDWVEVADYNFALADAPQPMCTTPIETNDTRLLNAVWAKGRIWTTHTVGDDFGKTEVAWYEVSVGAAGAFPGGVPNQQGRVAHATRYYYFPSIAVNKDEAVGLGFSGSGTSAFASGYYTTHDPALNLPGVTQDVGLLKAGVDSYWKQFSGTRNRWGDYSATVVDPRDYHTFWTVQEYAEVQFGGVAPPSVCRAQQGRWGTWWGSFQSENAIDGWFISFHEPVKPTVGPLGSALGEVPRIVSLSDQVESAGVDQAADSPSRRASRSGRSRSGDATKSMRESGQMWLRSSNPGDRLDGSSGPKGFGGVAAPRVADYQWDDGSGEVGIGVNDGVTGTAFGWANRFTNTTGSTITLTEIEVAFGQIGGSNGVQVGDLVDGVIWIDVAATGDMVNATKVVQWALVGGVHADDGLTFATHEIPEKVVVPAGADFYVGLGDVQSLDGVMRWPASLDSDSTFGNSWAFFDGSNNTWDPDNLGAMTIGVIDDWGLPGNWLIRANVADVQGEALAVYYCDVKVVDIEHTKLPDCQGHQVYDYFVNLDQCCLIHANPDSRSGWIPAMKEAFYEEKCFGYLIDIEAVIGQKWYQEKETGACIEKWTNKDAWDDYWGWHSTDVECGPAFGLKPAKQTSVKLGVFDEWLYGPWTEVSPKCSDPNMAFELYTSDPGGGDANDNCIPDQCECVRIPPPPLMQSQVSDAGFGTRNRYLSFTSSSSLNEAIRVTFESLPPPHDVYDGDQWFVGQPFEVTENSGGAGSTPLPTMWAANLQCGTPYYTDWSQYAKGVHVTDAGIIPSAWYSLQAIDEDCDPNDDTLYSAVLDVYTSEGGDLVGGCSVTPCTPPDGVVDFVDIGAVVDKFKNLVGAPKKHRADIVGISPSAPLPNRKVDFVDIGAVVDWFRSLGPPVDGPSTHCP